VRFRRTALNGKGADSIAGAFVDINHSWAPPPPVPVARAASACSGVMLPA
jgi:hypothetical protein